MSKPELGQCVEITRYVSLLGSGLLAGASLYCTADTMSAILRAPIKVAYNQWQTIYRRGVVEFPTTFVINAIGFSSVAYKYHQLGSGLWGYFAASALLSVSLAPFTVSMMCNIRQMHHKCAEFEKSDVPIDAEEEELLRKRLVTWRNQNGVRSGLLILAFGLALYATLF
jgi:hypothetical protein